MKEFKFTIDGNKFTTSVNEIEDNVAELVVNGTVFHVQIEKENKTTAAPVRRPAAPSAQSITPQPTAAAGTQKVTSPLPGSIVKVVVKAGDKVNVGDELLTMESMKMENSIKSEFAGTVKEVCVAAGQNVMQDDKLLEIETVSAPAAPKAAPAPKPAPAPQPAPAPKPATPAAPVAGTKVTSPLPGSVIKVLVTEGQAVKKGDTLLTLESMKMENSILAEQDGTVTKVAVAAGQTVMQDDLLIILG